MDTPVNQTSTTVDLHKSASWAVIHRSIVIRICKAKFILVLFHIKLET